MQSTCVHESDVVLEWYCTLNCQAINWLAQRYVSTVTYCKCAYFCVHKTLWKLIMLSLCSKLWIILNYSNSTYTYSANYCIWLLYLQLLQLHKYNIYNALLSSLQGYPNMSHPRVMIISSAIPAFEVRVCPLSTYCYLQQ